MSKLFTITTLEKLNQAYDYIMVNLPLVGEVVSYDTETNGSCPITKKIIGFSVSLYEEEGFYFPFLTFTDEHGLCTEAPQSIPKEGQNTTGELYECVSPAFKARALELIAELVRARLLMHNATFDVIVTRRNYGIDFINSIYCDTMLLKHTLDCDRPHGLKDCAAKYFGESEKEEQEELGQSVLRNGGKWTTKDKWIWYGDLYYVGKYACFEEKSSRVSMADGSSKYIEDVKVGDQVITHLGRPRKVYATKKHEYKGYIYNFVVDGGRSIKNVTEEHPFYTFNEITLKYEWVKAKDLLQNHLLVKPEVEGVPNESMYSPEFLWLIGLYLADGYVRVQGNNYYPVFTQHEDEIHVVKEILDHLGYSYSEVGKYNSKARDIVVCNSELGKEIIRLCGGKHKCQFKQIGPELFEHLAGNREDAFNLISGIFDGDGHFRKMKNRPDAHQLVLSVTSQSLINQVDLLFSKYGINCTLGDYQPSGNKMKSHRWDMRLFRNAAGEINKYLRTKHNPELTPKHEVFKKHVRINRVDSEYKETTVYNISVEEDETYISNGLITHNCKDTMMTLKLFNYLDPQLDDIGLRKFFYEDEVMPLLKYGTIPMKDTGFKIDVNHFKRAKLRIQAEIDELESQLRAEIADITGPMEQMHLDKKFAPVPKRDFALYLIQEVGLPIPINPKTGEFSTAKAVIKTWADKEIRKANEDQIKVIWYISGEADKVPTYLIHKVQRKLWEDKEDCPIINLGSPQQFDYIVGEMWNIRSPEKTKEGNPVWDADVIEQVTVRRMMELEGLNEEAAKERFSEYMECEELPRSADWFIKYLRKRKLEKLTTAFIDGILDLAIEGRIHPNMQAHGTTSGRYACTAPNLQNLPSHSALGMVIKRGFVS